MSCGRRYVVVFLGFIGLLISIGAREVFTMVIVHVIHENNNTDAENSSSMGIPCTTTNSSASYTRTDWPVKYVFLFQTLFYVGNIATQLPGGILAARFSPRRVCGVCIMLTSILTIMLRFAIQYQSWLVFVIRLVQGIIEGPTVPALNGVIAAWAPKSEKSKLITIAYSGAYLSAAIATFSTGFLICLVSWGSALFIYGGVGLVWGVVWLYCVYDTPGSCQHLSKRERELFDLDGPHAKKRSKAEFSKIPWHGILTSLPLSAILVAAFCRNWIFAILITQIPQYLKDMYTMSSVEVGLVSALPHVAMTVVVISGGMTVDKIIKKKWLSTTAARKTAETLGFGVEACCVLALGFISKKWQAVIILVVGVAFSGIAISGYQVNPLDLAPQYASVLTGIVRLGTIGSVLSTVVVSQLHTKEAIKTSWHNVFIIAGSLHLGGVIYYLVFASGNRQPWAIEERVSAILPHVASNASMQTDVTHVSSGYDSDESSETDLLINESLLTKSLQVERMADPSDEDEPPSWYMNTI